MSLFASAYHTHRRPAPRPFEYSTRQIVDGIAALAVTAVGLIAASVLLLGAWGW